MNDSIVDFGDDPQRGVGEFVPANRWQKKEPFNAVAYDKKLGWANAPQNERIAWNSAINNAVNSMGFIEDWDMGIKKIKVRAQDLYKLIIEGN